MDSGNEQIPYIHINDIRRELDEKITTINTTVNSKISYTVFFIILGGIASVALPAMGYLFYHQDSLQEKINLVDKEVVRLKTLQDENRPNDKKRL